ncbi:MAG: hypothetical protein IPP64_02925 [Bacteroidetes bacterium]|nr:hypothetical protein [Bacteroidota bacterium]
MNQLLEKIVRPNFKLLIIFGLLLSPFLIVLVHGISFSWMMGDILTKGFYSMLTLGFIIAFLIDLFRKTRLKLYALTSILLFASFHLLSYSSEDYLRKKADEQAIVLGEDVERYLLENGNFPENLEGDFFNDSPRFAAVGSIFYLGPQLRSDSTCYIKFNTFRGFTRCYNVKTKQFHSYD